MATEQPIRRSDEPYRRALVAASFPFRGLWFFVRSPDLWPLFRDRLLRLFLKSLLICPVFLCSAFAPQYAFLSTFHGPVAGFSAVVLASGESLVIMQGLYGGSPDVDICRADAFDATLLKLSQKDLVAPHRHLVHDAPNVMEMLGTTTTSIRVQPWELIHIIDCFYILGTKAIPYLGWQPAVFLPLVLIPLVGAPAFIVLAGTRLGKRSHDRWFQLRGLPKDQEKQETERRGLEYACFGTVALMLELIPVLSFLFRLTNTVGSAMWAARMEEENKARRERMR